MVHFHQKISHLHQYSMCVSLIFLDLVRVLESKCYVSVSARPISKCVNLQVIENKAADGIIDGINRLCYEVGVPKMILTDQDSGIMKALTDCEVSHKDLQHVIYKEKGIVFKTCPVSGHNFHGLTERKILSVQKCLERMNIDKLWLHATTLMKLIKNHSICSSLRQNYEVRDSKTYFVL